MVRGSHLNLQNTSYSTSTLYNIQIIPFYVLQHKILKPILATQLTQIGNNGKPHLTAAYFLPIKHNFGLSNTFSKDKLMKTHCGSLEYAAPELIIADDAYGPEVDVWINYILSENV
ncbi:hypothetical protein KUTeg_016805 [Tegillarca granosa]|uniref:Protein kinase domain-containing protein n=1 Tax=Tegillarca granosa TaxID=220873 RepID=A0ABQ9EM70_TEGGR|nr:hypothetical protein KUTeg_016805 [Tegillarca granosa]